jgi:rubrerythrin
MLKHRLMTTLFAVLVGLAWVGCDDSKSGDEKVNHDHAHQGQEHHAHEGEGHDHAHEGEGHHHHEGEGHHHGEKGDESAEETASVTVPKEGKEFDPAVSVDKLPKGAWHCNMGGKAHYAAMEKGDGRCPVCNMMLSKAE